MYKENGMKEPDAQYGYLWETALEMCGDAKHDFIEWMDGQTVGIENGNKVVFQYDLERFLMHKRKI